MIQKYLDKYDAVARWDPNRTDRARVIVPIVLGAVEGDILEIGAHVGTTTNVFCEIARTKDRWVIVIDPWDGRQQGNSNVHQQFRTATAHHINLTVHHMGSEDPRPREKFLAEDTKFAFILIDGLHNYAAVKNDIEKYADLLMPGGIICFDDWHGPYAFSGNIRKAVEENLGDDFQQLESPESFIEAYFVKRA